MKKPYVLAGISIFIWSTCAASAKLLLGSLNSIQIVAISALFAAIFLVIFNLATGKIKLLKEYKLKDYLINVLIGIPGTFLYYVFLYMGTDKMLASQAFIINYLWPIMSMIFACILLKEKLSAKSVIAIIMSFVGVIIVTGKDLLNFDQNTLAGAFFCILGAVSYGSFTALNQKFRYNKSISMMVSYSATFIFTTIIIVATGDYFTLGLGQVGGLLWNGVFSYAIGTTFWAMALESGKTAKISNLAYITPFLALVWTALLLHEPITPTSLIGLCVIVAGILLQLNGKKKTE